MTILDTDRQSIDCPQTLNIYDPETRNETIRFLNDILDTAIQRGVRNYVPILVDLSKLETLHLSAAVVLFARVTQVQLVSRIPDLVKIKLPLLKETRKLIYDLGLWDVLKFGTHRKLEKNWNTDNGFQSGTLAEQDFNRTVLLLDRKYKDIHTSMYDAINEAILNVTHHAYKKIEHTPNMVKRWWQLAHRTSDGKLRFFIYDHGQGIANSFNISNLGSDSDLIKHAMTRGVSSTKIPGRGHGSENLKRPVEKMEQAKLLVISHRGLYKVFDNMTEETAILTNSLQGTLIGWEFIHAGKD